MFHSGCCYARSRSPEVLMRPHPADRVAVVLSFILVWSGCSGAGRGGVPDLEPPDPRWESYLTHYTSGQISRRDKIRIGFVDDVVDLERVGQRADGFVRVEPAFPGAVLFSSARELVVVPDGDLTPGEWYRVTLDPEGLDGIPPDLGRFEFAVRVVVQDLEVSLLGLSPDSADPALMVLRGSLVTADVDESDRIEQIVGAESGGDELAIGWQHDPNGRNHQFTVSGIRRGEEAGEVRVAWNGEPIGVDRRDAQTIDVPARNVFAVTSVTAVQDERQYIVVQFSNELDPRQNINGLVGMTGGGYTTSLTANTLRIHPVQEMVGRVTVSVQPGVRSVGGNRLASAFEETVTFASDKPEVRFVGRGSILPANDRLTVPFEAINVRSVQVTAFQIQEHNVGQFLQANPMDGGREIRRVGRYLWRRTLRLPFVEANRWNRHGLDVTDLVREHRGSLIRLTLSINRGNSTYNCSEEENAVPAAVEPPLTDLDDYDATQPSSWDMFQNVLLPYDASTWRDRNDPCKDAYYLMSDGVRDERNFLASNIGMIAKVDQQGRVLFATTNLQTGQALGNVSVRLMNFQDEEVGALVTDRLGLGQITPAGVPFYAVATIGAERGYLKLSTGSALPTSHFDVGGAQVTEGMKGFIYGERGVWRPGDDIYLTFVLEDESTVLPPNYPVSMQLVNPNGQRLQSVTNREGMGGFFTFAMKTEEDAPTGNWLASATVGGTTFSRPLRIETVIPNRLSVALDLGGDSLLSASRPIAAAISSQWLHGATAANLKTDVELRLIPATTHFSRFTDFVFDDPARELAGEPQRIFEGNLDGNGHASFETQVHPAGQAAGMLRAQFTTRVFESGGGFSTNLRTAPFSPYQRYVGIKLPPGDAARGMLLTDTTHVVQIATLADNGAPTSVARLEVTLYKIGWRWWWDRSGESLAQYASTTHRSVVERGEASTSNGSGTWEFEIAYPAWGRYLLRVCDPEGGHCTGRVFYIDWPGWAGQAREDGGVGASVLSFSADRERYSVGDVARVQLPEATEGRALVTVENGTEILEQRWVMVEQGRRQFDIPITAAMSPNVYVSVTLVQPHAGRGNDRPIRLYGIIPLAVDDPATRLHPRLATADEWRPTSTVPVEVSESDGRPMTYTLAVVDEGLLGLTSYQTPELHDHFYQKEALGVTTWDLFDEVVDAYGGELERLLALGGGGEAEGQIEPENESRFPPVVRFLGPFHLEAGGSRTHQVDIPSYIGAVRVMLVAGEAGAYGSASKTVIVRDPLSMLATIPRVVGPEEEFTIPIALFATDPGIRDVRVTVDVDDRFEVVGSPQTSVRFAGTGEQLAFLRLRAGSTLGPGRIGLTAVSGQHRTESDVTLEVRSPNPVTVEQIRQEIAPDDTWSTPVAFPGLPGTNSASLELTTLPPLGLERRLRYLIRYPHGCIEQVTSAVFPQLFLPSLVRMDDDARADVEGNIRLGIDRLRAFQLASGEFAYWPGGFLVDAGTRRLGSWVTNYVGHFLVEADRLGYYVPADMLADWVNFQRTSAQAWSRSDSGSSLEQSYRLYTLALAGKPEMGAMNRLREGGALTNPARWLLAAAYQLGGLPDIAQDLARGANLSVDTYDRPGWSLGSALRDRGIVLMSLVALDRRSEAQAMAQEISDDLFSDRWHSTHSVAFALLGMAKFYDVQSGASFSFRRTVDGAEEEVRSETPVYTAELSELTGSGGRVEVVNTSGRTLYGSVVVRGVPRSGDETAAASGLSIRVEYHTPDGRAIDVADLTQGTDFLVTVTVTNNTRERVDNLALTHMVPAGWEIHNARMQGEDPAARQPFEYQDIRDDRILTYFGLDAGEHVSLSTALNATYLGRFYLPGVSAEAMYDVTIHARSRGQWVLVRGADE